MIFLSSSRRSLAITIAGLATLTTSVIAGCADAQRPGGSESVAPPDLARLQQQKPAWHPCPVKPDAGVKKAVDAQLAAMLAKRECTEVSVPLDYRHPERATMELAVNRIPALGRTGRRRSLVFNPGGPGGSGLEFPAELALQHPRLARHYDLVGFDPRGTGQSSPVRCLEPAEFEAQLLADPTPDTPAERVAADQASARFAAACGARSGRLLPFLGLRNSARDLEVIRAALGESRLNFYGLSWGGSLGAVYADLFPASVGRLVIDSPGNPTLSQREVVTQQMRGSDRGLTRFAENCVRGTACQLGADPATVLGRVDELLESVDSRPLPAAGGRRLTESLARLGLLAGLYHPDGWPKLEKALAEASRGDGTGLADLSGLLSGRQSDGTYTNFQEANTAINCADYTERYTVDQVDRIAAEVARVAPRNGPSGIWATLQACAHWPASGEGHPTELSGAGAPPILVVGNTGDPDGVYEYALDLAQRLKSAALLTWNGDRHGAYPGKSTCIDAKVDSYLLDGAAPGGAATCS